MNLHALLQLAVAAALINNLVFTLMVGVCPLCGPSRRLRGAFLMGVAVIFVMGITAPAAWAFNRYVLIPHSMQSLQIMAFVLLVVLLVQLMEMALEKLWPRAYEAVGDYFPMIATNCAVLAVCLLCAGDNPVTGHPFTGIEAFVNGVASGAGFLLATVLMAGIQIRLELSDVPAPLRGLPITLLSAGLVSLAFLGFTGLSFNALFGG
jgi:Na+-translocating ferredoxin:NAD+ oxidoreductase subunit A